MFESLSRPKMSPNRFNEVYTNIIRIKGTEYWLLAAITLLAAILRFYKLGEWSFWIDEIYTVNHAVLHFSTPKLILENIPPLRNWLPISVLLTAQIFNMYGINEFTARMVAAVIGVITVPVLFFPIKKIFNARVAMIAVLLLAVSPWHIEWSQNARGYSSLLLFYSLALFVFILGIERDCWVYFVLFFFFLYLASSERLIALFIIPVIFIYLLVIKFLPIAKPVGLRPRNMYILLSPVVLFGIFQIYSTILKNKSVFSTILNGIVTTFVGKSIENPLTQATFIVFKLGVPLFVLSIFCAVYLWTQRNRQGLLLAVGAFVPFILLILVTPFMFTEERYAFITLPSWLILSAIGVNELLVRLKKYENIFVVALLIVLLADAMGANLLYFHTNNGNRRDWKGAFAIVQENMHEGDAIVSTWPELGNYYLNKEVILWQDVDTESIMNSETRVWFVVIPEMAWYTETEDLYWWVSHDTRFIKDIYIRTVDNTNIEIYLFDPSIKTQLDRLKY